MQPMLFPVPPPSFAPSLPSTPPNAAAPTWQKREGERETKPTTIGEEKRLSYYAGGAHGIHGAALSMVEQLWDGGLAR
jgi:hypothetical protein